MPATIINSPTRYLVGAQAVATLVGAAVTWVLLGSVPGYSVLLGGLISLGPNAWFASMVFRHSGARATEALVRSAYLGELIKLLLAGTGFALSFALVDPLYVPGLFAGFVLVHVAGLLAVIRHARLAV